MQPYNHKEVEKKWQDIWESERSFAASEDSSKKKSYLLIEFPYPSGAGLHVGHPRSYTAMDVLARKRRMDGENVLYPIGFDAFGLPTENYAIKTGRPPAEITKENCDTFRRQLKALGFSFDWSREVNTTDPNYYKWTQWIFLKLYEKGLAYKATSTINWCPKDKIGLAHEEVVDGKCERCGNTVEQREKEQWMLKITEYADRLLQDLDTVDYLPRIKTQQVNWIGRSEGVNLINKVKDLDITFEVYDSVPQTFMAQTFAVIAPEHPLIETFVKGTEHEKPVLEFVEEIKKKKAGKRFEVDKEIEGIFTGRYIENYAGTGRDLPIWVASFAVMDYGTGMVNCSVHDERDFAFAKKYDIPLHPVMFPADAVEAEKVKNLEYCYHHAEDGIMAEPVEFKGRKWGEVRDDIIDYLVDKGIGKRSVQYKLRDWVFSRQRYWGEPIPMIKCDACASTGSAPGGWVPVPKDQLPITLPEVEKYEPTDTGESPLAAIRDWVETTCPKCGGKAERETDTMPNWAGSSWYYLRYADAHNDQALASKENLDYWTPVDWYNGGMEHTTLHLLYSRFWHKFLFDIGIVPTAEPYMKRTSHGMILAEDNTKMSKSKGNVVNPDEIVETFGADTLRTYEMFMGPFADTIAWSTDSLVGVRRFLDRVYYIVKEVTTAEAKPGNEEHEKELRFIVAKTVKKVGNDIENYNLNTAVSSMMELVNHLYQIRDVDIEKQEALQKLLLVLQPFAPHLTAELWSAVGGDGYIWQQAWPSFDEADLVQDTITIAVQVNGKLRGTIEAPNDIEEEQAFEMAKQNDNVAKWLTDKELVKQIYVPGKLVNFVVR